MAVRYQTYINSLNEAWRIDILDADFSGTASEFIVNGFKLSYEKQGDSKFQPIKESSLEFIIDDQSAGITTLISDMVQSEEKRFQVALYKHSSLFWAGNIIIDNYLGTFTDEPYPTYIIRATDGIGSLNEIPYDNDGTLYTGTSTFIEILLRIIEKTGLSNIWNSSDFLLKTCVNWYDAHHAAVSDANDPLLYSRIDNNTFINVNNEGIEEALSSLEVLQLVCETFQCRFFQSNGNWYFVNYKEFEDNTNSIRGYRMSGTQSTYTNVDWRVTPTGDREAEGQFYYSPMVKKVKLNYNYKQGTNNNLLPISSDNYNTAVAFGTMQGETVLMFSGDAFLQLNPDGSNTNQQFLVEMRLKIKIGSYYLKGSNTNTQLEWTTNSSDRYVIQTGLIQGAYWYRDFNIKFITPEIPSAASGSEGYFEFDVIQFLDIAGNSYSLVSGSSLTMEARAFDLWLNITGEELMNGTQIHEVLNEDGASNTVVSSVVLELNDTVIGDGPNSYSTTRIQTSDTSTWVNSTAWQINKSGDAYDINDLRILCILGMYKIMRNLYQGTFSNNDIVPNSVLIFDSKKWIMNSFTLTIGNDIEIVDGEWFEIASDLTNNSVQTPTEKKRFEFWKNFENTPTALGDLNQFMNNKKIGVSSNQTITGDETFDVYDAEYWNLIDTSGGNIDITLPAASIKSGIEYKLTLIDESNIATIVPGGGDTINGNSSYVFSQIYETIVLKSTGTEWIIN